MANEMIKETEQVIDQEIVMALSIDRVMGLLLIGVNFIFYGIFAYLFNSLINKCHIF